MALVCVISLHAASRLFGYCSVLTASSCSQRVSLPAVSSCGRCLPPPHGSRQVCSRPPSTAQQHSRIRIDGSGEPFVADRGFEPLPREPKSLVLTSYTNRLSINKLDSSLRVYLNLIWSRRRGSNPQPADYKSAAQPIVLLRQFDIGTKKLLLYPHKAQQCLTVGNCAFGQHWFGINPLSWTFLYLSQICWCGWTQNHRPSVLETETLSTELHTNIYVFGTYMLVKHISQLSAPRTFPDTSASTVGLLPCQDLRYHIPTSKKQCL